MKKIYFPVLAIAFSFFLSLSPLSGQQLSLNWEDLTASDFVSAVKKSEGVCLVPIGVIEKHGQHLPLGTDVFVAREMARRAATEEYCVIYPFYFQGQILNARHQPGTIAHSPELILRLLEETCSEIARNGLKKIILVNGHGGNQFFLQYFCQMQMASPRDYAVYYTSPISYPDAIETIQKKIFGTSERTPLGLHAGSVESSAMLVLRPDLVKLDRMKEESGANQKRLQLPADIRPGGIAWYASYPNHYSGDDKDVTVDLGEVVLGSRSQRLAELIKAVKADETTLRLQEEYFKETQSPLETKAR